MSRDLLLPVRLVDGVWTTDGAVEIGGQTLASKVTYTPPPATQSPHSIAHLPPLESGEPRFWAATFDATVNPDAWREFVEAHQDPITVEHNPAAGETTVSFDAEATCPGEAPIPVRAVVTWTPPRRIFAAVALDGSGVWAIGDSAEEARTSALDRRDNLRDQARSVDCDFPPPETDAAWLDTLTIVTLSGTTEGLRALIKSMETGDPVAPWCPQDLWDNPEPVKEP